MIVSRGFERNSAPRTTGRGNGWNSLTTTCARQIRPMIFWDLAAKGTFGRKEKINQEVAQGPGVHVRAGKLWKGTVGKFSEISGNWIE